jgi:hypothetical protein
MEEMMGILGEIARKFDRDDKKSQKPEQERGPTKHDQ